jgi:hypothetical protein
LYSVAPAVQQRHTGFSVGSVVSGLSGPFSSSCCLERKSLSYPKARTVNISGVRNQGNASWYTY